MSFYDDVLYELFISIVVIDYIQDTMMMIIQRGNELKQVDDDQLSRNMNSMSCGTPGITLNVASDYGIQGTYSTMLT